MHTMNAKPKIYITLLHFRQKNIHACLSTKMSSWSIIWEMKNLPKKFVLDSFQSHGLIPSPYFRSIQNFSAYLGLKHSQGCVIKLPTWVQLKYNTACIESESFSFVTWICLAHNPFCENQIPREVKELTFSIDCQSIFHLYNHHLWLDTITFTLE